MPSRFAETCAVIAAASILVCCASDAMSTQSGGTTANGVSWRVSEAEAARRLQAAYPDAIREAFSDHIVWRDGTVMPIAADPPQGPNSDPILDSEDLRAIFQWPYHGGAVLPTSSAPPLGDPGRARPRRFFDKVYGRCDRGDVRGDLTDVAWVPGVPGPASVKVSRQQGAASRIATIASKLKALPADTKSRFLVTSGAYNCRAIAGTSRPSAHGYGIAIDIAVKQAAYWRWAKPDAHGRPPYHNSIPVEIVALFEENGFIWGGRWEHFDTMHFEYRPELLLPAP